MIKIHRVANPLLYVMVGLPYSGKTTEALRYVNETTSGGAIVSPDAIRLALTGQRFYPPAEPMVWATAQLMVRALFNAGQNRVIVDATHTTNKARQMWREFDVNGECGELFFCHVPTDFDTCVARAWGMEDDEIEPVIKRMARQFEPFLEDDKVITLPNKPLTSWAHGCFVPPVPEMLPEVKTLEDYDRVHGDGTHLPPQGVSHDE